TLLRASTAPEDTAAYHPTRVFEMQNGAHDLSDAVLALCDFEPLPRFGSKFHSVPHTLWYQCLAFGEVQWALNPFTRPGKLFKIDRAGECRHKMNVHLGKEVGRKCETAFLDDVGDAQKFGGPGYLPHVGLENVCG